MACQLRRWGMTVLDEGPRGQSSHSEDTHHQTRVATTQPRLLHLLHTGRE
jgi:hypothetical protein